MDLKAPENSYHALIQLGNDMGEAIVMLRDLDGKKGVHVYAGDVWAGITGYTRDELIGMSFFDLVVPKDRDTSLARYILRMSGKPVPGRFNLSIRRKGGKEACIELSSAVSRKGNIPTSVLYIKDVTESNQRQINLEESEERYRTLVELGTEAGEAIIMLQDINGLEGIQTFISDRWLAITGYCKEELLGTSIFHLLSFGDRTIFVEKYRETLMDKPVAELFEISIMRKNGTEVPVELTIACTTYQGNRANVIYIRDASAKKLAQKQLQETAEKMQLMFESLSDGIAVTNLDGVFVDVNIAMLELYGLTSRDEIIGKSGFKFISEQEHDKAKLNMQKTLTGCSVHNIEHNLVRKDGSTFCGELSSSVLKDSLGKPIAFITITRDVTEQREMRSKLEKSENLYRTAFETTGTAMSIIEDSNIVARVNKQWEKMYGYSAIEAHGMPWYKLVAPEVRALIQSYSDARSVNPRLAPSSYETLGVNKKGKIIDILLTVGVIPGTNDRIVSSLDITARNRALKQLRVYKDNLEKLIQKRTEELRQSMKLLVRAEKKLKILYETEKNLRKEIEFRMKERIDFTRSLVHELKTPLTPLLGATDLLSSNLKEAPWSDLAGQAYKGALDLNKRIDDLFDLTRMNMGRLKLNYDQVELYKIAREIAQFMAPLLAANEHRLELQVPRSLPSLRCDQQRIKQILINLIENAIKHTPEGTLISLICQQKDSTVLFRVKDTGPGIPKDRLLGIFKPYSRVDSDREHFSGLGLGLALCKTFVELHGGHIWARSTPGKGSSFNFIIPLDITRNQEEAYSEGPDHRR
jgi:PAS domain S-box-containing protein